MKFQINPRVPVFIAAGLASKIKPLRNFGGQEVFPTLFVLSDNFRHMAAMAALRLAVRDPENELHGGAA